LTQGEETEKKIKGLAEALEKRGYKVFMSCQGHRGSDWKHCFPWVAFQQEEPLKELYQVIETYNKQRRDMDRWELCFARVIFNNKFIHWLKPVHSYKNLDYLQEQALILASFINSY